GASAHARVFDHSGRWALADIVPSRVAFRLQNGVGARDESLSRLNGWPMHSLPTLRPYPRGHRRTVRGRCGSLLLHRTGLSPPTPCRFKAAHSVAPSADRPEAHKRVAPPRPSERSLLRSATPSASSAGCDHCAKFRRAPDEGSDAAASPAFPCAVPWWRAIRARRYAGGHGTIKGALMAADPARERKSWRKTLCHA